MGLETARHLLEAMHQTMLSKEWKTIQNLWSQERNDGQLMGRRDRWIRWNWPCYKQETRERRFQHLHRFSNPIQD